jgi:hypothetical protein
VITSDSVNNDLALESYTVAVGRTPVVVLEPFEVYSLYTGLLDNYVF